MTDNELIQALRVCAFGNCDKCSRVKINGPKCINDLQQIAADRLANQNTHILALQREIEGLRKQNQQLREASALLAKESADLLERRWIPVTERLPEDRSDVLVVAYWHEKWGVYMGWCAPERAAWSVHIGIGDRNDIAVTHWMPLPEGPEVR